jgi:hypothetical protein
MVRSASGAPTVGPDARPERRRVGFLSPAVYLEGRHSILVPSHTPRVLVPARPAEMKRERQCIDCRAWNLECGVNAILRISEFHTPHSTVESLGLYPQL